MTLPYVLESKKPDDTTSSENDITNETSTEQTADVPAEQAQAQKANAGNVPIHVTLRYLPMRLFALAEEVSVNSK